MGITNFLIGAVVVIGYFLITYKISQKSPEMNWGDVSAIVPMMITAVGFAFLVLWVLWATLSGIGMGVVWLISQIF